MTQREQRRSEEIIVVTNKLALLYFLYVWFLYDRMLFWLFYTDVLSQALSEDAA